MHWIKTIFSELYSVFVDDGSFAIAILVWALLLWLLVPRLGLSGGWNGALLFSGLCVILVESALRRARK